MTAADETIVLGAKDKASKVLEQVGDNTRRLGQRVNRMSQKSVAATKRVEIGFHGLKTAMGPMLAAFAAFKGVTAGFKFLGDSSAAFETQQEAVRGLTKAIELSGETVGPTIAQHEAFASALQASTNVGDEVTLGLMKQAKGLGVANDSLQSVTQAAIGLSEITGQSLDESLKKVNETINGNSEALAESLPQLRNMASAEEKLSLIQKTASDGLAQKADRAKSSQGAAERAANSWGDFSEKIGEMIAPIKALAGTALATLAETLSANLIPAIEGGKGALASMKPVFDAIINVAQNAGVVLSVYLKAAAASFGALKSAIFGNGDATVNWGETITNVSKKASEILIGLMTGAEVFYTNLGTVLKTVGNTIKLAAISAFEDIKHTFTVQIPGVLTWFSDNWKAIITDTFNAALTATQNYASNTVDMLKRLWEFVASGGKGGFEKLFSDIKEVTSRPLLDGFAATLSEMPNITERAITDTEQRLAESIGKSASGLGEQWRTKFEERISKLGFDAVTKAAKQAAPELPQIKAADDSVKKITDKIKEDVKIGGTVEVQALQAKESRLLTRGNTENRVEKELQNNRKELRAINQSLKEERTLQRQQLDVLRKKEGFTATIIA